MWANDRKTWLFARDNARWTPPLSCLGILVSSQIHGRARDALKYTHAPSAGAASAAERPSPGRKYQPRTSAIV
jgi:hypothetical protein